MLINGRFTTPCLKLFLAIFENRDWDAYYQYTWDKPFMNTSAEIIRYW